jgi:hypothetical protein
MKKLKHALAMSLTGLICSGAAGHAAAAAAAKQPYTPVNTCTGTYPGYWQDVDPKFAAMWKGQTISNAPTTAYTGPVFKLSDDFPRQPVDDRPNQPWRDKKFDALFDPATSQEVKAKLAHEYGDLVFEYALAGNVNQPGQTDFDVCKNPVRPWYHMPFQTYATDSGREFTHGLTREAPVTFSVKSGTGTTNTTVWAVAIYNATAAYTLGTVWQKDGTARVPTDNIHFDEGAVIAKPLFNTATLDELPILTNMPSWQANISDPSFCSCPNASFKPSSPDGQCTQIDISKACPRSHTQWGNVRLMQMDFSVRDARARGTGWVYGTYVADGLRKAKAKDGWHRLSLLGVMWGNDTPPEGQLAINFPANPRKNGFKEEVIFWDVVDQLNASGGSAQMRQMGHLGSNYRLNGPADNANSSCMSCHGTASVPDANHKTPPLITQFDGGATTFQSVAPVINLPTSGVDRSGVPATEQRGVTFSQADSIYFANVMAGTPFNTTVKTSGGDVNILGPGMPSYSDPSRKTWIALDYSLQLAISLNQWAQWQEHQKSNVPPHERKMLGELRRNK